MQEYTIGVMEIIRIINVKTIIFPIPGRNEDKAASIPPINQSFPAKR